MPRRLVKVPVEPTYHDKAEAEDAPALKPRTELDLGVYGRVLDTVNALAIGAAAGSVGVFVLHLTLWLGASSEAAPGLAVPFARFVFNTPNDGVAAGSFQALLLPFVAVSVVSCALAFCISTVRCLYYACEVYEVVLDNGKDRVVDTQARIATGTFRTGDTPPERYWRGSVVISYILAVMAVVAPVVLLALRYDITAIVGAAAMSVVCGCAILISRHYRRLKALLHGKGPKIHERKSPQRPDGLRDVPENDLLEPTGLVLLRVGSYMWLGMMCASALALALFGLFVMLQEDDGSPLSRVYDAAPPSATTMTVHWVMVNLLWVCVALSLLFLPFPLLTSAISRIRGIRLLEPAMALPDVADTHPRDELSAAALTYSSHARYLTGASGALGAVLIVMAVSDVEGWAALSPAVLIVIAVVGVVAASIYDFKTAPQHRDMRNRILATWPSAFVKHQGS